MTQNQREKGGFLLNFLFIFFHFFHTQNKTLKNTHKYFLYSILLKEHRRKRKNSSAAWPRKTPRRRSNKTA